MIPHGNDSHWYKLTNKDKTEERNKESKRQVVVIREAPVGPTNRPPKPARELPTKGKKTRSNKSSDKYIVRSRHQRRKRK